MSGSSPAGPEPSPFARADSLRGEGDHTAALAEYLRLRDSLRATSAGPPSTAADSARLWRAEVWSAHGYVHAGEPDSARAALAAASALTGPAPARRARTAWVRSLWHDRRGELDSALAQALQVRELAEEAASPELEAAALNALGRTHSLAGRYREALEVHEAYLRLQRRRGDPRSEALALNELGIDYRHFGRFDDAAEAYREALAIYRDARNREGMAIVLYNLANVQLDMGRREEALALLSRSLEHAEAIDHTYGRGLLHNNLGKLHLEAGNLADARRHLERARALHRNAGLAYGGTVGLTHLGRLEQEEGRPDAARRALLRGLARADSAGLGRQRADALTLLSRVEREADRPDRAVRYAEAALAAADSLRDPEARYEALVALGAAREAAGGEGALAAYRRAVGLLESWRGRLALGDLRPGVTAPRLEAHEGAIRILLADGRAGEAFRMAESARARLLLDLLADRPAAEPPATRVDSLRSALRNRYRQLRGADEAERPALEADLSRLAAALEAAEAGAGEGSSRRGRSVRRARPVGPGPVRERLLRPGIALLAYFWGERRVYGWRVSPDGIRVRELGPADSMAATVGFLRSALRDPAAGIDWRPAARRLYDRLVAPLRPGVGDLLVVPDGPLAALPFEVLPSGPGDRRPLGLLRRVTYGPSASVLLALSGADAAEAGPERGTARALVLAGTEPPPGDDGLPALPHAREEARRVASTFPSSTLLSGEDATVERWLAADPGNHRYLHFATHARVDERWPGRSHLVLADGPLDLPTIRELDLEADLVTLSGCETGLGPRVPGEGVLGLAHAFLSAGARGVLATLWRVRDPSAARFMEVFYRHLRERRTPAEALRAARRAFVESGGDDAHPARWAPYVLVGTGR